MLYLCSLDGESGVFRFWAKGDIPWSTIQARKKCFYCVNTSYPIDNCFNGRCDRSRQTPEKDVLYIVPAGPVTECAFARWRIVRPSCLDSVMS